MSDTILGAILGAVVAGGITALIAYLGFFRTRTHASAINDAKTAENDADINKLEPKVDDLGKQLGQLATSLEHVRGDIAKLTDVRERIRVLEAESKRTSEVEIAGIKEDMRRIKEELSDKYVTQKEFDRIDDRFKDLNEMLTKFMDKVSTEANK